MKLVSEIWGPITYQAAGLQLQTRGEPDLSEVAVQQEQWVAIIPWDEGHHNEVPKDTGAQRKGSDESGTASRESGI